VLIYYVASFTTGDNHRMIMCVAYFNSCVSKG